eukprot:scaffold155447_cov30-Tisochrysis_lutea.AAC.2
MSTCASDALFLGNSADVHGRRYADERAVLLAQWALSCPLTFHVATTSLPSSLTVELAAANRARRR